MSNNISDSKSDYSFNPLAPSSGKKPEESSINKIPPKALEKILVFLEKEPYFKDLRKVGKTWNAAVVKMTASKEGAAISAFINFLGESTQDAAAKEKLNALAKNTKIACSKRIEELNASKKEIKEQLVTTLKSLSKEERLNLYTRLQTADLPKPFSSKDLFIDFHIEKELRKVAGTAKEGAVYQQFFQDFLAKGDWKNAAQTAQIMYRDHKHIKDNQLASIIEKASHESVYKKLDTKDLDVLISIAKQMSERSDRSKNLRKIVLEVLCNTQLPTEEKKELALYVAKKIKNRKMRESLQSHIETK